jgi:hypothetical protein
MDCDVAERVDGSATFQPRAMGWDVLPETIIGQRDGDVHNGRVWETVSIW